MTALDTNVLLYACDKGDPRRQAIALEVISTTGDAVLLWQVACEFVAASRKPSTQGFTASHAWDRLADFLGLFPLLLPTPGVLDRARLLYTRLGWSFWGAMIIGACLEAGVRRLYSEDLPGQALPGELEIVNPFA